MKGKPMEKSHISHTEGASSYVGKEAVNVFACYVIAHGMKLYAKTGIKPCRGWTSTIALQRVQDFTGMRFKRTQLLEASQFLILWANAKRMGIEEVSTRPVDIAHMYAMARWGVDWKAETADLIKRTNARGAQIFEEIDREAMKYDLIDPMVPGVDSPENIEQRKKAIAHLREITK